MLDLIKGFPDSPGLESMFFGLYMYSSIDKTIVLVSEEPEAKDFWYLLFSGVKIFNNNISSFRISQLQIRKEGSEYMMHINGKDIGIRFSDARILSEDDYSEFETMLPNSGNTKIVAVLSNQSNQGHR